MEKLTDQEKKAIKQAINELGYFDVAENEETLCKWYEDGTASINIARNGRTVAWVLLESAEKAIYVDTLEKLTEEEIESELC
nr:MAG TPA: Flagellar M-ring protein, Flagellar motor motor, MS-ring, C-ring, MOTOR.3A [Caudoviricetes sp.]